MSDPLLPDQIAARLRRAILRGTLPPGSSIKERDNAAELGVSRTPLREAVRVLANEGLVILRPSRTPVVASPTYEELADYVEVLLALERLGGELACARITSDELDRLTALHDRLADTQVTLFPAAKPA